MALKASLVWGLMEGEVTPNPYHYIHTLYTDIKCTHTHTHTHTHTRARTHAHIHAYIHAHAHTHQLYTDRQTDRQKHYVYSACTKAHYIHTDTLHPHTDTSSIFQNRTPFRSFKKTPPT